VGRECFLEEDCEGGGEEKEGEGEEEVHKGMGSEDLPVLHLRIFFFFLVVLEFELGALCLLNRCSTI
jgi:hypothetical protein